MMDRGVCTACARLPACVRARCTMRAFSPSTWLNSLTSGCTSCGKRPCSASASPRRTAARRWRSRCSGRSARCNCTATAAASPAASVTRAMSSRRVKPCSGSATRAWSAATVRRSGGASSSGSCRMRVSASSCRPCPSCSRAAAKLPAPPPKTPPEPSWADGGGAVAVAGRGKVWSHSERERAAAGWVTAKAPSPRAWSRSICQYTPESGRDRRGSPGSGASVMLPPGERLTAAESWSSCTASCACHCAVMCS